ncbi:hypothetical protein EC40522_A0028 [Escherichia coli 4.0522]|nr:hypothetical protein EC40522_A0028 [Escherichia coli 4.0522]
MLTGKICVLEGFTCVLTGCRMCADGKKSRISTVVNFIHNMTVTY